MASGLSGGANGEEAVSDENPLARARGQRAKSFTEERCNKCRLELLGYAPLNQPAKLKSAKLKG